MRIAEDDLLEYLKTHSQSQAAEHFGLNRRSMQRRIKRIALRGHSPDHDMTHTVPDGFKVKGVSSLYNRDGELTAQWVKSSADDERRYQMMVEACEAMADDLPSPNPSP